MRRALRRYGPWLCVPAVGGMFVQGLIKFAAPAPRWDMLGWVACVTVVVLLVSLVRRASGPSGREVRAPKWYYEREMIIAAGLTAALVVPVCLGSGAMQLTPKVERILAADPVIRSSTVTEVTHVRHRSRGSDTYTVQHRLRFDSGTRTVQSTLRSGPELTRGSTVWVLYVPGRFELGGETEESRGELEALQGGRADNRMLFALGAFLVFAALFLGMGFASNNKPLTKGAWSGRLRVAPAAASRTGIAGRRMQSLEPPDKDDGPQLRQTSGPFVELALRDGMIARLFVHRTIEPAALARQLGEAAGTLYWDGAPPTRGADTTWALFVLDSGEELPGFVQDSESFIWPTAGTPVDRTDKHPLELRPVLHPFTWQPGVQSWGVPFTAGAVAALWAYGYYGSAGAVWGAFGLALLAPAAKGLARRRYFERNGTDSGDVDADASAHAASA